VDSKIDVSNEIVNLAGKLLAQTMQLENAVYKFDGSENPEDVAFVAAFQVAARRLYENAITERANRMAGPGLLVKLLKFFGLGINPNHRF
jgi:hypothetical protein